MSSAVAAIVLAAGASRRLGHPKQLLAYGNETLLQRSIRFASEAGAAPVFAVLGAHADAVAAAMACGPALLVLNQQWERGIASSIHAGLGALNAVAPHASAALILPCDQPRLTAGHLRALIEAFTAQTEPSIVASTYAEVLGVPAIFPRSAFAHLHALSGDKGARALLADPPCALVSVPFPGGEVDIDIPADLTQLT